MSNQWVDSHQSHMTMAEYTEYRTISQYFAIFELQSEYSPLMRELCLK